MSLFHEVPKRPLGPARDEPRRVSRLAQSATRAIGYDFPLYDAKVTLQDVRDFWKKQPFDLELVDDPNPKMGTYQGNCDFCFLKSQAKLNRGERFGPGLS